MELKNNYSSLLLKHSLDQLPIRERNLCFKQIHFSFHDKFELQRFTSIINQVVTGEQYFLSPQRENELNLLEGQKIKVTFYSEFEVEKMQYTYKEKKMFCGKRNQEEDFFIDFTIFQISKEQCEFIVSFNFGKIKICSLQNILALLFSMYYFERGIQKNIQMKEKYCIQEKEKQDALSYWERYVADYEEIVEIPKQYSKEGSSPDWEIVSLKIEEQFFRKMVKMEQETHISISTVLQTMWGVLLQKYNNCDDVIFGTNAKGEQIESYNTILMRIKNKNDESFRELLKRIHNESIQSQTFTHALLSDFEGADHITNAMFFEKKDVFPSLEQFRDENIIEYEFSEIIKFDFSVYVSMDDGLTFKFNKNVYTKEFIQELIGNFNYVMSQIIENPMIVIKDLNLITLQKKHQILCEFNDTDADYPKNKTISCLFEEQVNKTPKNIALVYKDTSITYEELNQRVNQLARILRRSGIQPGDFVGVLLDRSPTMIVATLGILKAGGTYVPIDPEYPQERISYILEDSKVQLLLTEGTYRKKISKYKNERLIIDELDFSQENDSNVLEINTSDDTAYVIYTSGSTGKPKGILTSHRNVIKTIVNNKYLEINDRDNILQLSNYAFDASTFDIYGALLNGAKLVLVTKDTALNPFKLGDMIQKQNITISFMTTALFNVVAETNIACLKNLKKVLFGGEKASIKHVQKAFELLGEGRILNMYGPTETTVYATYYEVTDLVKKNKKVPIGKPISNTKIYVLDKNNKLQPPYAIGEICISGDGVAKGYLNRLDLTREKFVAHPFIPGDTIYRTGDLGYWLPDGNIEFIERADHQVKIRGHRIELGEIEKCLMNYSDIKEAIVITKNDAHNQVYLCAYLVMDSSCEVSKLREYLAGILPNYMIPSYFVQLDSLPLTLNGKVDKKALPNPDVQIDSHFLAPSNEVEEKLTSLWKSVLNIESVGANDNFFHIGGHSLKAMVLIASIFKEFGIHISIKSIFANPTIKELAQYIASLEKEKEYKEITRIEESEYYPVSSAQKRLYAIQKVKESSTSYNICNAWHIEGNLDIARLEYALHTCIERHEALRTSFHYVEGELVQRVHSEVDFKLLYHESTEDTHTIIYSFVKPFVLSEAPLLRAAIVKLKDKQYIFMIDIHHIIADGISMGLLYKEISQLYQGEVLAPLKIQYKDYAVWQQNVVQQNTWEKKKGYWINQLNGELPILQLPTDYIRPPVQTFEGKKFNFSIGVELSAQLRKLASEKEATLYMVLLAAYHVLLARHTGQNEIVIGSPIAGRTHGDLDSVFGMFVNTIALRNISKDDQTFNKFLSNVKESVIDAYEHSEYPLEELIEELNIRRDVSRNPLFDTMFILQNMEYSKLEIPSTLCNQYDLGWKQSKLDLSWEIYDFDTMQVSVEYSTSLFEDTTIQRMAQNFVNILEQIVLNPNINLSEIDILTMQEKQRLLVEFNETKKSFLNEHTIQQMFEEQVKKTPNQIAVVFQQQNMTYKELNEKANQLARHLRSKGITRDQFVGIMVNKSIEMVVGVLAVLKAGGAYIPIDPKYPLTRIYTMLQDSGAKLLLTQEPIRVPEEYEGEILEIDRTQYYQGEISNLEIINKPSDLAYMIYTSGSTGNPKGVMIEHQGVCNFSLVAEKYGIKEGARVLQFASFSFDASVAEIFHTLLTGATLYVEPKETLLLNVTKWLKDNRITSVTLPPSLLRVMEYDSLPDLQTIVTAGESCTKELVQLWGKEYDLINAYGPTEATIGATFASLSNQNNVISIGKPVANKKIYIINKQTQLQPIGVPGELCIGGIGLARGYWNRPDLTKEKFIPNPFEKGEYIYRTGDLARWLPNGNIEFLGRIDHQVKIKGHRIEIEEIMNVLLKHKSVKEVAIIDWKDEYQQTYLCAYIVFQNTCTILELRKYLTSVLPDYMIPSHFVELEKIPLTPNNKVDRQVLALHKPKEMLQPNMERVAPRNDMEQLLVEIWTEVLKMDQIGINDNFLELGGDSIKGIQIAAKLNHHNYKLDIKDLYEYPTIAQLAPEVKKDQTDVEQGIVFGEGPLTPIQEWFFKQHIDNYNHWNQAMILKNKQGWNEKSVRKILEKIVEHHDALRMRGKNKETQFVAGLDKENFQLHVFDLKHEEDIENKVEKEANLLQKSIDLKNGPLVQSGLFHTKHGDYLLIIIHHFVIDGISWRIFLEDFYNGYEKVNDGKEPIFPVKTTSYLTWSKCLQEYRVSEDMRKELAYWKEIDQRGVPSLKKDMDAPDQYALKDSEVVTVTLEQKFTESLLTNVHRAYRTEVNDLLLSALVLGIQKCMGINRVSVMLEGHGREDVIKHVNIARTIGWFTSIYPVIFELKNTDLSNAIKEVKETLRRVPNKGVGYSILKYLDVSKDEDKVFSGKIPEINFNYLGEFNDENEVEGLAFTSIPIGKCMDPCTKITAAIEINGMVVNGEVNFIFRYNPNMYYKETIENIANMYIHYLIQIVHHCEGREDEVLTPSDFSTTDIDLEELGSFLESLN
ncbi:non-ribosomal peptide synthetase [Bacillus pseudomycoides]|uniref:non-ribosomal peptide synthetase n=1 Tax=Bacillus pseudomycoides TaxID=64104 RepID=UPI001FB2A912|nr:non-ribosomal peptide synthetase [Bacillus pseudomycoides]